MENLKFDYIQQCINIAGNTAGKYEARRAIEELADIHQKYRKMYDALHKAN